MSINRKNPSAVIFGCSGISLTEWESAFFRKVNPFGFILFARNIRNRPQVRNLVNEMRSCVGRSNAPVLIDQEGGRVQRLKEPLWKNRPAMSVFSDMAAFDPALARKALRLNNHLIARDLAHLGIDVDCAPVLDLLVPGMDAIIGDRALGMDAHQVIDLGRAAIDGLLDGGVMPVIKHLPGHGRAAVDSHLELPVVETDLVSLGQSDFAPFRGLRDAAWGMTAHVVYNAIDDQFPATLSRKVIGEVIRGFIGFEGLLLSDDLSMKALRGDYHERAKQALDAGCDIVLHCNGKMDEMEAVASAVRDMDDLALERADRARQCLRNKPLVRGSQALLDRILDGDMT